MDNGHTIQVDLKNDENYVVINGQKYELLQFHFHATSEHTLNGHAAKMEVHLVHKLVTEAAHAGSCVPASGSYAATPKTPKAPQVQLAVIGVMIESGTKAHPFIKDLWSDLGAVKPNDGGIRFRLDGPTH
jgi:carbonic anhydrase